MTDKMSLPQPQRRFVTPYVMVWALLAGLSAAYLFLLLTQPASVTRFMGAGHTVSEEELRAIANAVSEVRFLRESMGQIRMDIDEVKAEVAGQAGRDRDFDSRIAALETRPQETARGFGAGSAQDVTATARGAADKRERPQAAKAAKAPPAAKGSDVESPLPQIEPETPVTPEGAQRPADTTTLVAKSRQKTAQAPADAASESSLETGSVNPGHPAAVTFGPAIVTPAAAVPPKTFGLQIGTGPSVDSLRMIWSALSDQHGDDLKSLQPRYISSADASSGLTYDLVVGPVNSSSEAKRICKELSLKGTPCKIGDFAGNAFQ